MKKEIVGVSLRLTPCLFLPKEEDLKKEKFLLPSCTLYTRWSNWLDYPVVALSQSQSEPIRAVLSRRCRHSLVRAKESNGWAAPIRTLEMEAFISFIGFVICLCESRVTLCTASDSQTVDLIVKQLALEIKSNCVCVWPSGAFISDWSRSQQLRSQRVTLALAIDLTCNGNVRRAGCVTFHQPVHHPWQGSCILCSHLCVALLEQHNCTTIGD